MITRTFLALFGVSLIVGFILIYIIFYFSGIPSISTLLTTNYVMMIIHFLVAIVMFTASSCKTDGWEMFYEREVIPEGGLEGNNVQEKLQNLRKRLFEKETEKVTITSIFKLCALFSFITALAHGFLYFNKSFYSSLISSSQNPFRWLEYFFSSGIMMACIASISDIKTEYALLSVFAFTAITNIFGMAIEATSSNRYKWAFMFFGFIPYIIPWYMIAQNYNRYTATFNDFKDILDEYGEIRLNDDNVLTKEQFEENIEGLESLKTLIIVICLLYNLFPLIQIGQILFPNKYQLGEFLFILISLISKVTLNSSIYSLGNRPSTSAEFQEDDS